MVGPAPIGDKEAATHRILTDQRLLGSPERTIASGSQASFGISPHHAFGWSPVARLGEWLAVGDLRLHNNDALASRLGDDAAKTSDSEILLRAWRKAGEASLNWVVGDFALAIYDPDQNALFLARDVAGQFPLFFARSGSQAAFSSMPSGLRSFVGKFVPNKLRIALTACDTGHDDHRSHFAEIERVLPGEVVRIANGEVTRRFYWQPPPRPQHRSDPEWIEEYRAILDAAVACRVKGAGPIATQLSSGWDSSAVTTTAARILGPAKIVAYTSAPLFQVDVPEQLRRFANESAVAGGTAEAAHVRHVIVRDLPPFAEVIRRQALLCEEPIPSVPNLAWSVEIRRLAAENGAQRLLAGTLGNLTLNGGGLYLLSEWLRLGHPLIWLRQATAASRRGDVRLRGVLYNSARPWMPAALSRTLERSVLGIRAPEEMSFLRPEWLAAVRAASEQENSEADINTPRQTLARIRALDPGMLRKGGLADHGVLELDPLGDRRCIDFAVTLPPDKRYWNGIARPLARAALADRVPAEVLNLKGRGLQGADWALRFTKKDAQDMLEEVRASSTAADLLDLERIGRTIERWPTANTNKPEVVSEFRIALMGALSCGLFAAVHEAGARSKA